MCTCYANWQGNDCSRRLCPFGVAFTTTPRGDLNLDGDRNDNSNKLLVTATGHPNTGHVAADGTLLAMSAPVSAGTLVVGDAVRLGGEVFAISALRGPREFVLDRPCGKGLTGGPVYKHLETPAEPEGAWESCTVPRRGCVPPISYLLSPTSIPHSARARRRRRRHHSDPVETRAENLRR
jgi:hypothetical protein